MLFGPDRKIDAGNLDHGNLGHPFSDDLPRLPDIEPLSGLGHRRLGHRCSVVNSLA